MIRVERIVLNGEIVDHHLMSGGQVDRNILLTRDFPALGDQADLRAMDAVLLQAAQDHGKENGLTMKIIVIHTDKLGVLWQNPQFDFRHLCMAAEKLTSGQPGHDDLPGQAHHHPGFRGKLRRSGRIK